MVQFIEQMQYLDAVYFDKKYPNIPNDMST